jgi:hypothetical protein
VICWERAHLEHPAAQSGPVVERRWQWRSLGQRGECLGDPWHVGEARRLAGPPGGQQRHRTLDLRTRCIEGVHQVAVEGEQAEDVAADSAQPLARQPSAPDPLFLVQSPLLQPRRRLRVVQRACQALSSAGPYVAWSPEQVTPVRETATSGVGTLVSAAPCSSSRRHRDRRVVRRPAGCGQDSRTFLWLPRSP